MSDEADRFWEDHARDLRRKKGYCALTPEEAQKELESLDDHPPTKEEMDEINKLVDAVTSGNVESWTTAPEFADLDGTDTTEIEEDVLQLNKNAGEGDEDTDELLKKLRRESLTEDEDDGEVDKDGLDGTKKP